MFIPFLVVQCELCRRQEQLISFKIPRRCSWITLFGVGSVLLGAMGLGDPSSRSYQSQTTFHWSKVVIPVLVQSGDPCTGRRHDGPGGTLNVAVSQGGGY